MIDYAPLDSAIGHDWYELDPDLQARVPRDCPPEDREWAEAKLHEFGTLIGTAVAPNAEIIDANPPQLVRYDRWANEVDAIEHHPATLDSKRALWESGYVSGFAADETQRGRPVPGVVVRRHQLPAVAGRHRARLQPRHDRRRRRPRRRLRARRRARPRCSPACAPTTLEHGIDGSMFLTERDGGSDLGRTVHCTARDIGDGRVLIDGEKWFCSNIDGAAIVMLARPEGAPDGPARPRPLPRAPATSKTARATAITMRRLKHEARHQERADRRGRVPRRRSATRSGRRADGDRGRSPTRAGSTA